MKPTLAAVITTVAVLGFASGALAGSGCGSGQFADPGGRAGTHADGSTHTTSTQIATEKKK